MHTKYVFPNVFMTTEDTKEISNLQADIQKRIAAAKSDWIMNGFTDADWDQLQKDLEAYGLEKYLSIFQKYVDEYYK
jgi:putative aldouronate transport system substrate-binding protein